jgi:hypothetical protein
VILGLTRGDLILVGLIFGLIYLSGLLPRIAKRLGADSKDEGAPTGE